MTIPIDTKQRGQFLTRKLLASQETMVFSHLEAIISLVSLLLLDNCDFLFYLATQANLTLFTHIINYQTLKILIKNAFNKPFRIFYRHKLRHLINIAYENCFLSKAQSALDSATSLFLLYQSLRCNNKSLFFPIDSSIKTVLDNGVKIYGDAIAVRQIADLVAEYPTIWKSQGFV